MAAFYSPETGVQNFTTRFPVLAVNEAAKTMAINFSSVTFDPDAATQGVTNIGTAPMQNGIAFIPVTFNSSDPKSIKLALKHKGLKIDSSASAGSVKPDPRAKPRFIVVLVAYEVVVVGVAAATYASAVILEQLSKQRGATLPEVDFSGLTNWFAEAGNKVQSAVATVSNYVTVAIHASSNTIPFTAPFPRFQPVAISPTSPCHLPNYVPPTGQALQDLKNAIQSGDFNTFGTIFKIVSSKLYDKLKGSIFKIGYLVQDISGSALNNTINGTFRNITTQSSYRWLKTEAEYTTEISNVGGKPANLPQRYQAFGHMRSLIEFGKGLIKLLKNSGEVKQNSIDCYSENELDALYAILDLINDLIDLYNSKL